MTGGKVDKNRPICLYTDIFGVSRGSEGIMVFGVKKGEIGFFFRSTAVH